MMAPVKKTKYWFVENRTQRTPVCGRRFQSFVKVIHISILNIQEKVPVALHLNLGYFERSGINIPTYSKPESGNSTSNFKNVDA